MSSFFSFLIPASFPALALAHFFALISPGPDFFLVVGHAARSRLRGTIFICAGIALGNALYIALAVAGWSAIRNFPVLYTGLELAGAAYLIWMGVMLLRSSRKPVELHLHNAKSLTPSGQLVVGLGSALLNPKNAVFYLTLMTVIIGPEATLPQQAFAGTWMTLLVFAWDVGLAAAISLPKLQETLQRKIPWIEGTAGCVLILLAVALVCFPLLKGLLVSQSA